MDSVSPKDKRGVTGSLRSKGMIFGRSVIWPQKPQKAKPWRNAPADREKAGGAATANTGPRCFRVSASWGPRSERHGTYCHLIFPFKVDASSAGRANDWGHRLTHYLGRGGDPGGGRGAGRGYVETCAISGATPCTGTPFTRIVLPLVRH